MADDPVTLVISYTHSGRVAVMARRRAGDHWRQVDSCDTAEAAATYAATLDGDPVIRAAVIGEWEHEQWGKDSPIVPPSK